MWTRVERVAVACSGRNIAPTTLLEAQLCARVAALARVRSPYPVVVGAGSLRDVTLRVERIGGQLTIRATRPAIEDEVDSSSAAVPIGLRLDGDGLGEGADAAIAAALDRVLPWRGQRASGTPPRS